MLKVLFPETVKPSQGQTETFEVEATNSGNEVLSLGTYDQDSCNWKSAPSNFALVADQEDLNNINGSRLRVNYFWEIFEALKSLEHGKDPRSFLLNVQMMKVMQNFHKIFDFSQKHSQMSIILYVLYLSLCKLMPNFHIIFDFGEKHTQMSIILNFYSVPMYIAGECGEKYSPC